MVLLHHEMLTNFSGFLAKVTPAVTNVQKKRNGHETAPFL